MSIHDGHRERMKQEFLDGGLEPFSDVRALELLLFFSRRQGDVNPTAHALLKRFETLAGVFDADLKELKSVPGVGDNTALLIKLVPAMAAKYMASRRAKDIILTDAEDLKALFSPYFFAERNELSYLACFDSKLSLLGVRKISEGSPTATDLCVRQLAAEALALNASAVVLAHNHPNGVATPSDEDLSTTRYLRDLLLKMGIVLYDHVILADEEMLSLRDSGYFFGI